MVAIVFILATIAVVASSYFLVAGVFALICWAFGLTFSWKVVWGIYGVMLLVKWAVSATSSK